MEKKHFFFLAAVAVSAMAISLSLRALTRQNISDTGMPSVTVWQHGRALKLNPDSKEFPLLVSTCEKDLGAVTDSLNLIVSASLIRKLRTEEFSVELVYRRRQEVRPHGFTRPVVYDHLLIPLSGYYAGMGKEPFLTFFWGVGGYGSGPFVNPKSDPQRLCTILKGMVKGMK